MHTVDPKGREIAMTPQEFKVARERGRSLAAQALIMHPEKKAEMERKFGLAQCRIQYPEAYGLKRKPVIVLP